MASQGSTLASNNPRKSTERAPLSSTERTAARPRSVVLQTQDETLTTTFKGSPRPGGYVSTTESSHETGRWKSEVQF